MVNVWAGEAAMSGVATECASSVLSSFARTSRSQGFGERRKATTGTSLKMFLKMFGGFQNGLFLVEYVMDVIGRAG